MDSKVGAFEQKIKESAPGYRKGEQKPVGQRDWNPSNQGIYCLLWFINNKMEHYYHACILLSLGAHSLSGYNAQTTSVNHGVCIYVCISFSFSELVFFSFFLFVPFF